MFDLHQLHILPFLHRFLLAQSRSNLPVNLSHRVCLCLICLHSLHQQLFDLHYKHKHLHFLRQSILPLRLNLRANLSQYILWQQHSLYSLYQSVSKLHQRHLLPFLYHLIFFEPWSYMSVYLSFRLCFRVICLRALHKQLQNLLRSNQQLHLLLWSLFLHVEFLCSILP